MTDWGAADGTPLSGDTTATIEGQGTTTTTLPELSIADAEVEEGPNAKLVFFITLSEAATHTVTFDIATSDGDAIAGEDYRAKSMVGRTFEPGDTRRRLIVKVLDDAIDEGDETMTAALDRPQAFAFPARRDDPAA